MRGLLACLFLASMIGAAVEWGDRTEGELRWGETLQMGEYSLEAADFTPEDKTPRMVMLNLRKDGELIATRALKSGDSFSLDDEVMVVVEEVRMTDRLAGGSAEPRAEVLLQVRAVPELVIRVVSEEDSYEGGDRVKLEIEVENAGMAEAEDLEMEVTFDPQIVSSRYTQSDLAPGEVWDDDPDTGEIDPIELSFVVPSFPGPQTVHVMATAHYLDSEGDLHESRGMTSFEVFGPLKVYKYAEDEMNFGERSFVHLSVRNVGNRSLEVELSDSPGRDFRADSNLEWNMTVPPSGTQTASYTVTAKKPGYGQILPPAEAAYSIDGMTYSVGSASPVIDVIGPLVEVEKKASSTMVRPGESVTVTLTATNAGNRRTKVSMKETVQAEASLTSGETELSRLLLPGESAALVYAISWDEPGRFEIPATVICYQDDDGTSCNLESSRLRITVEEEEEPNSTSTSAADLEDAGTPTEEGAASDPAGMGTGVGSDEGPGDDGRPAGGIAGDERGEGAEKAGPLQEGSRPGGGSILWGLSALILIIFVALDRYL
ncbi:MAG TPA: hypothetical protein PLQ49_00650 [Methanothrix sp.]|nr:hypothetical protein [Methanothrix sp.]HRW82636.1 hypothetical protein [Methanothrix sp.]